MLSFIINSLVLLNVVNGKLNDVFDSVTPMVGSALWPNAIVPYYIDTNDFDNKQKLTIMYSIMRFQSNTNIMFFPLEIRPIKQDHALVIENPSRVEPCTMHVKIHFSIKNRNRVTLGYNCATRDIETIIMAVLGVPKDDLGKKYFQNIKTGNKKPNFNNQGLSKPDYQKVNAIYNLEHQRRDYGISDKDIYLCQNNDITIRQKRDLNVDSGRNNSASNQNSSKLESAENINNKSQDFSSIIKEIGIENEMDNITAKMYKIIKVAFEKARLKHCSNKTALRTFIDIEDDDAVSVEAAKKPMLRYVPPPGVDYNEPHYVYSAEQKRPEQQKGFVGLGKQINSDGQHANDHKDDDGDDGYDGIINQFWKKSAKKIGAMAQMVIQNVSMQINF